MWGSRVYSPHRSCEWTAVRAEDELISRWCSKRMERLHTTESKPVSLHGRSEDDHVHDYDGFYDWLQVQCVSWFGSVQRWVWYLFTANLYMGCHSHHLDKNSSPVTFLWIFCWCGWSVCTAVLCHCCLLVLMTYFQEKGCCLDTNRIIYGKHLIRVFVFVNTQEEQEIYSIWAASLF